MQQDFGWSRHGSAGAATDSGPLVRVRLSFSRTLWRSGPAWAVLAGAVAVGWAPDSFDAILRLIVAIVLGDLAWGSLRPSLPLRPIRPDSSTATFAILPYGQPGAPLSRLLVRLAAGTGLPAVVAWQPLAIGLAFIVGLSLLIGLPAVALSVIAGTLTAWAWLVVIHRGGMPAATLALLDIALPGWLGMSVAGSQALISPSTLGVFALLGSFTLLQWGMYRVAWDSRARRWGVWAGQIGVLLALIALRQPWACAVVATLFAPPVWWLTRGAGRDMRRALPWWWAAFLVAFLATLLAA